jgi:hypothetical protein
MDPFVIPFMAAGVYPGRNPAAPAAPVFRFDGTMAKTTHHSLQLLELFLLEE